MSVRKAARQKTWASPESQLLMTLCHTAGDAFGTSATYSNRGPWGSAKFRHAKKLGPHKHRWHVITTPPERRPFEKVRPHSLWSNIWGAGTFQKISRCFRASPGEDFLAIRPCLRITRPPVTRRARPPLEKHSGLCPPTRRRALPAPAPLSSGAWAAAEAIYPLTGSGQSRVSPTLAAQLTTSGGLEKRRGCGSRAAPNKPSASSARSAADPPRNPPVCGIERVHDLV